MEKQLHEQIEKLALAYETGWEYRKDSAEAGSVIAGICLDMLEENRNRFSHIWDKQMYEFLKSVPEQEAETALLAGSVVIDSEKLAEDTVLSADTGLYGTSDTGQILCFRPRKTITATPARLLKAYYTDGYNVWQLYDNEDGEGMSFKPSASAGEPLERPVFEWKYSNLCNCMETCRFQPIYNEEHKEIFLYLSDKNAALLHISDGVYTYCLEPVWYMDMLYWEAVTPDFAENREETVYTVSATIIDTERLSGMEEEVFTKGPVLLEEGCKKSPQIYMMDGEESVMAPVTPFLFELEEYACCYIACDRILGRENENIVLTVEEEYLTESVLPEPKSKEYIKKMRKYAWMLEEDKILQWKASDTIWEYFNGEIWCMLSDSQDWQTGCRLTAGCFSYTFQRPADMQPCVCGGNEHYYLRLRLRRIDNAYARYYHKTIPVLKSVFMEYSGAEYCPHGAQEKGEEDSAFNMRGHDGEADNSCVKEGVTRKRIKSMYLAFSHRLPRESALYVETRTESGDTGKQIIWYPSEEERHGWDTCFGVEAYYLIVPIESVPNESREEAITRIDCNYAEVIQEESTLENVQEEGRMCEGNSLLGVTKEGVQLCAHIVKQGFTRIDTTMMTENPLLTATKYYYRFNRLVTARDIISLCMERYPMLREVVCCIEREEVPVIKISFCLKEDNHTEEEKEFAKLLQKEIKVWLLDGIKKYGNYWLSQYQLQVSACFSE